MRRTWLEISQRAFHHNVTQIKSLIGSTALGVVVKANAYGHGMIEIATIAEHNPAISWLFTAGTQEAQELRAHGSKKPILAMAYLDSSPEEVICQNIRIALYEYSEAQILDKIAQKLGKKVLVHIKIDTGMSRLGLLPEEAVNFIQKIINFKNIEIEGIFTHLADTNNPDLSYSYKQLEEFDKILEQLTLLKIKIPIVHALSSGALLFKKKYSLVRVGTNIFGFWKSPIQEERFTQHAPDFYLEPVATWKTCITHMQIVAPGSSVGYARTFIAERPTTIAVVPVGYADGYARTLAHKAQVLVHSTYAPVLGIISMNLMALDVTDCGSVTVGDEVILMGKEPYTTATHTARLLGTINNEFATRISPLIERKLVY